MLNDASSRAEQKEAYSEKKETYQNFNCYIYARCFEHFCGC